MAKFIPSLDFTVKVILVVAVMGGVGVIGWTTGLFSKLLGRAA